LQSALQVVDTRVKVLRKKLVSSALRWWFRESEETSVEWGGIHDREQIEPWGTPQEEIR